MTVSNMNRSRLILPSWAGVVVAGAGLVSLLATYWDDAWHTDIGRDDATIPPHLWLYGSVAVAGLVVVWWWLRVLVATRSIVQVLRQAPLMVAAAGGAATLAAAPLDAMWHAQFGRDSVVWSPPHILVVFGSEAMILGVIAGTARSRQGVVEALLAALMLGGAVMMVIEYETDVPQFSAVYYLPILLLAGLMAGAVARAVVPLRAPVTAMVTVYVVFRLIAMGVLGLLDRSMPELPIAVLGLCVLDLPWRNNVLRYAAGAAAVSALAWLGSVAGLANRPVTLVAAVAVPALVVFGGALLGSGRRGGPVAAALVAAVVGGAGLVGGAGPARAHDPGQGETVLGVHVTGVSDGNGLLSITVEPTGSCSGLVPTRVVARRAGDTMTDALRADGDCKYAGAVRVPDDGRWFVYAEFQRGGEDAEVWLPLRADRAEAVTESRDLYRSAEATTSTKPVQIAAGVAVYAVGLALLGAGIVTALRRRAVVPVP